MDLKNIIVPFAVHLGFLPVIAGLFFIKRLSIGLKIFLLTLIISLATDLISYYGFYLKGLGNMDIFNLYNLIDAVLTLWVLFYWIENKSIRIVILFLMIFVTGLWLFLCSPWTANFNKFNTLYIMITGVINTLLVSYNLYYYTENKEHLSKSPEFWILVGLFIYNFCPLLIEAVAGSILMNKVWIMYNFISITSYILFTRGFLSFIKLKR